VDDEIDIKNAAMGFEAIKVSMSQDRNGVILRLNVHPNDCPSNLHTDWVGTRYMVGMVKLTDDDKPDDRADMVAIEKLIASAGLLCRNDDFGKYMVEAGLIETNTEDACVSVVREICGIKSRSEFRHNTDARQKFESLREDFRLWMK
tara:strand:- start:752 stop:1192 length:441 start_codon:yes stop_codon:yes gene_type:complete